MNSQVEDEFDLIKLGAFTWSRPREQNTATSTEVFNQTAKLGLTKLIKPGARVVPTRSKRIKRRQRREVACRSSEKRSQEPTVQIPSPVPNLGKQNTRSDKDTSGTNSRFFATKMGGSVSVNYSSWPRRKQLVHNGINAGNLLYWDRRSAYSGLSDTSRTAVISLMSYAHSALA